MLLNEFVPKKYMQKRYNKRGISPLIATILLIGLTIAIAAVLWGLFRGVTIGATKTSDCGATAETALALTAEFEQESGLLHVDVTNVGAVNIDAVTVVAKCSDNSATGLSPSINTVEPGEEHTFSYNINPSCSVNALEVYPAFIEEEDGRGRLKVCTNKKIEVVSS